ncbi:hypothetical protein [Paenibacillus sp. Marseille-Q4541]|uniref:hypothetical protein n=1 Tax=Paenibacillus sp. Marseille-Q4541 TaxID=2831522 RepID=UPI002018538D|nr:hypothetical protein [Paenibacillus sp. Marseille-Q4541]
MTDNKIKIIAIKTKSKVYISDNVDLGSYFHTKLSGVLVNGEPLKNTYKKDWFETSKLPDLIQKQAPGQQINVRYELKETHYNTGLPKVLQYSDFDEDTGQYEAVYGLYDRKYDMTEPSLEEVKFELNIIEELDEFEIVRSDFNLQHSILDQLTTHPVLLSTKPCKLSRQESYSIVRNYVKSHIDNKWAAITSDYDFCFTVSKKVEHEPESYRVNVGKRKPKYETRYTRSRTVKVYEVAPKTYDRYPVIEPFEGKNEDDLKNNIQKFLDELMERINKPLVECEHCKGFGVISDEV